jgi:carboxypeptidase Q
MPTRLLAAALLLCQLLPAALPARAQQPPAQAAPPPAQGQAAPQPATNSNDPVERIKEEGMNRSQVMQILSHLTDVIGPRLTNSPQMKRANEWTRDKMREWGMQNERLEPWGPFGRGWSLRRFSAEVVAPQGFPLIAYPKAWSPGTQGPLTAEVVHLDASDEQGLEKYRGRLRGKIVLTGPPREVRAHFDPQGTRLTEKQLLDLANAPEAQRGRRQQQPQATPEQRAQFRFGSVRLKFLHDEGAALLVDPGRGDGGNLFVGSAAVPPREIAPPDGPPSANAPRTPPAYAKDAPAFAPQIVMAIEHYNRLVRMLRAGVPVTMAVNLEVQFHDEDLMGYNTVAEIPGGDLRDEVVMLGGHLDSWHGGTGATDNAAGVAVAMEAARIIQALGLKPRRTIRVALWGGEEQGLLGSRAYVREHFGEIVTPTPQPAPTAAAEGRPAAQPTPSPQGRLVTKPAYDKFSAYFNLDNGTGRIRGVYMQGNEAVRPVFRQWLQPFAETGAQTLSVANTGGTDHLSFDAIGLPGFQFIQDQIEYSTRTHHSTQDLYDRIQADDMKQAATVMAAFVYQTAMRDERLPRKPAPGAR